MNRNVSIVIVILVVVVLVGYFVWLRSKVQQPISPKIEEQVQVVTPTAESTLTATPSATPGGKEATGSVKAKIATSGATRK